MSKRHRNKKKRTKAKRRIKQKKKISVKQSAEKKKETDKKSHMIYFLITLVGLIGSIITIFSVIIIKPRVSVRTGVALNPINPVFTTFIIRNDGKHLAFHDVKVSNAIVKIEETEKNVQIIGPGDYSDSFSVKEQVARVIRPGEEYSIELPLSRLQHHQFGKMDIAIKVSFKWLFRQKDSLHRFETKRGEDGQWHWQPQPVEK